MVSLRRSRRRHPLIVATAVLFTVLIATPFTAPFSSCSPAALLAPSSDAIPPARCTTALVGRDQAERQSHHDSGGLTEDQFKDEAAIADASVEETTLSSPAIALRRPPTASFTRAIPSVLRL